MPRSKISAKYLGDGSQYFNGIPARDLSEDEFEALPDEHKALLAQTPPEGVKPLYELRHDAPAEAAKAARRQASEAAEAAPPEAVSVTPAGGEGPAKK